MRPADQAGPCGWRSAHECLRYTDRTVRKVGSRETAQTSRLVQRHSRYLAPYAPRPALPPRHLNNYPRTSGHDAFRTVAASLVTDSNRPLEDKKKPRTQKQRGKAFWCSAKPVGSWRMSFCPRCIAAMLHGPVWLTLGEFLRGCASSTDANTNIHNLECEYFTTSTIPPGL